MTWVQIPDGAFLCNPPTDSGAVVRAAHFTDFDGGYLSVAAERTTEAEFIGMSDSTAVRSRSPNSSRPVGRRDALAVFGPHRRPEEQRVERAEQ